MTPTGLRDVNVLDPTPSPAASSLTTQISGKTDHQAKIPTIAALPIDPNRRLKNQLYLLPITVRVRRSPIDPKSGLDTITVVCNRGAGNEPFDEELAKAAPVVEIYGREEWGTKCTLVKIIVCHARLFIRLMMQKEYVLDLRTSDQGELPQVKSVRLDLDFCCSATLDADSHLPSWGNLRR